MKNNKKKLWIVIILIIIISIIGYLVSFNGINNNIAENKMSHFDINGNLVIMRDDHTNKSFELDDGKITFSKFQFIEVKDGVEFSFNIKNNTDELIDVQKDHYFSVYDKDNNLLTIIGGEIVGTLSSKTMMGCSIKLNYNLTEIDHIVIKKINIE